MSTEQNTDVQTNGHDHGGANGTTLRPSPAYQWLPAADLPDHLSGAVIPTPPTEEVDETRIWGDEAPDPDALERAVERARRTVQLQSDDALRLAKTPSDIAADLAADRAIRELERSRELHRRRAEVAEAEAQDRHQARLRQLSRSAQEAAAEARQEAERIANPWYEVVRTWRARKWLPLLGTVPAVFSLVAGAVNVGSQLDRIFPGVPFISWVVDPIISILIVVVGATHLYGSASAGRGREWVAIEAFLFALTGAAAVGLHYVDGPGEDAAGAQWGDVGPWIWLFVPIGLGASMWIVPKVRAKLSDDLVRASTEAAKTSSGTNSSQVRPTPSDLHGTNADEGAGTNSNEAAGTNSSGVVPDPEHESLDSIRARLRKLAEAGEFDPETVSVNAARESLGVRRERAEEALIAEYGRPDLVERRRRREAKKKDATRSSWTRSS